MPTITATVHQVLRYFFVGAIAATFVAAPPGEAWSGRFASFLADGMKPGAAVFAIAMLVGGSLIYGTHRVVIYPWIFRIIIWTVLKQETSELWCRLLWPYGKAISCELRLEELGSRLKGRERERFAGWASEAHLFYLTTEIALLTLYWPGWRETTLPKWALGGSLGLLLFLVAAWDQQSLSVLVDLGRKTSKPVPK